jgi:excisionase family DNA binding protein
MADINQRTKPYTTNELAKVAGVDDSYLWRLLIDGKLSGEKYGKTWLSSAEVAEAWLARYQAKQTKSE